MLAPFSGERLLAMPSFATAMLLLAAYVLGSIPFGVILTTLGGAGDLRKIGSGNIGATNVLRTGRKGLAAATLLLDGAKGAVAVLIAQLYWPELAIWAAAAAFLGHLYPIWLKFRGGKGVATMLGVTLALYWPAGLTFAVIWLAMLALTKRSSLGGISAAASAPIAAAAGGQSDVVLLLMALALLLIWKHRGNIARLLDGTEPKVGEDKVG
jgi:glycerol-3-phosphate acyltransferase PlsY